MKSFNFDEQRLIIHNQLVMNSILLKLFHFRSLLQVVMEATKNHEHDEILSFMWLPAKHKFKFNIESNIMHQTSTYISISINL